MCIPPKLLPLNSNLGYHIHIYFHDDATERAARELADTVKSFCVRWGGGGAVSDIERVGAVGPHTKPNYEIDVGPGLIHMVGNLLMGNGGRLSILLHPDTGNFMQDHFGANTTWLGEKLPFNPAFIAKFNKGPQGPRP